VDQELEQAAFCRIHRSAIVNLERVRQLEISEDGGTDVVLNSGTRLRLSRRYRKDLQARLRLQGA
jgi:two-component system LytT family response regulator